MFVMGLLRLGGVFTGLWLGLIVLLFGSVAELVPLSVIAGMLFVIGAELIVGRLPDARLVLASSSNSSLKNGSCGEVARYTVEDEKDDMDEK